MHRYTNPQMHEICQSQEIITRCEALTVHKKTYMVHQGAPRISQGVPDSGISTRVHQGALKTQGWYLQGRGQGQCYLAHHGINKIYIFLSDV